MDVTTATPAEIDTELARLEREKVDLAQRMRLLKAQMAKVDERIVSLGAEYSRRGGWARVYRVNNDNGHVHNTTACRTTYYSTDFVWFPELSGLPARQIVTLAGEYTCLTCFGQVRAEILEARKGRPCRIETDDQRKTRENRERAEAEKAAREVARNAKALVHPVELDGDRVTTKAAAWSRLTEAVIDAEDWSDPTWYDHLPAARRAANLAQTQEARRLLTAALRESSPELDDAAFDALLTKKVKARKARYNKQLKDARLAPRY